MINQNENKSVDCEGLKELVGVKNSDFALDLITSAGAAIEPFLGKEEGLKAVIHSMNDLKPQNSIEARLVGQSAVLYEYSMKAFKRAGEAEALCHIEAMSNLAIKLMRAHNETIETFNRCKRGSEHRIIVEHMTNQVQMNNFNGGVPQQSEETTPCIQENAVPKQELMAIDHAKTLQWEMGDVECMADKVLVRRRKKVCCG